MQKNNRILVFSGPSGGHLFPAQAFAEEIRLQSPEMEVVLVTSIRAEGICSKFPKGIFSEIAYLPEFGAPGLSPTGLKAILRIPQAMIQSWSLITRISPDLCVGFGSFVSYFGVLFASWRGIPTLIHEQNQVPGKATRMLQNTVQKIALSFPKTAFRRPPSNTVVTGLPIRRSLREGMVPMKQKTPHPFTVLVCGGSQGSNFLNEAVLKSFSLLSAEERARFAVIHITGASQEIQVRREYAQLNVHAEVCSFLIHMQQVYNRAHMGISRAGANSSFEQALYGIPTVFIPYPHAEGHQNDNARFFVSKGAAMMHVQNEHVGAWLASILSNWVYQPTNYWDLSRNMSGLADGQGHARLVDVAREMMVKL